MPAHKLSKLVSQSLIKGKKWGDSLTISFTQVTLRKRNEDLSSIVLPPSSTAAVNFKRYPRSQLITRHKIKPLYEGKWRRANRLALGPDKLQQQNMAIYITIRCANKTKRDKSLNNLQCKITARVYILHHHIVTQQKGCVFSKHPWTWCTRNRE